MEFPPQASLHANKNNAGGSIAYAIGASDDGLSGPLLTPEVAEVASVSIPPLRYKKFPGYGGSVAGAGGG